MTTLRLGTRGSPLALFQAHAVAQAITATGGPTCDITIIRTSGDRQSEAPLSEIGGKRLFVKEIEDALASGEVHLAVHSAKDMPALLPEGFAIAAVLPREDPHDALVLPASHAGFTSIAEAVAGLGQTPTLGTGSVRRVAQLKRLLPRARFMDVRGNLDTRLRKLDEGGYQAIVLAAAGLRRLGHHARISLVLPTEACVPSPGQGVIAIEIRADDARTRAAVAPINDAPTAAAFDAERALIAALGGGCQLPVGALARILESDRSLLRLDAVVASLDGQVALRAQERGAVARARALGERVARILLDEGAADLLQQAAAPPLGPDA